MGGLSFYPEMLLQLRTGGHESLSGLVAFVLLEVLDEASGKILCLLLPFSGILVGVAGVENACVNSLEFGGNLEVEIRYLLGRSLVDAAVEDSVDDSSGVTDGDALACAVPARVHEISLCAALLHPLDEFLCILCGMQFEESLSEAGGEGGSGLGDSTLGSRKLGCESAEEVVLGLLGSED